MNDPIRERTAKEFAEAMGWTHHEPKAGLSFFLDGPEGDTISLPEPHSRMRAHLEFVGVVADNADVQALSAEEA